MTMLRPTSSATVNMIQRSAPRRRSHAGRAALPDAPRGGAPGAAVALERLHPRAHVRAFRIVDPAHAAALAHDLEPMRQRPKRFERPLYGGGRDADGARGGDR